MRQRVVIRAINSHSFDISLAECGVVAMSTLQPVYKCRDCNSFENGGVANFLEYSYVALMRLACGAAKAFISLQDTGDHYRDAYRPTRAGVHGSVGIAARSSAEQHCSTVRLIALPNKRLIFQVIFKLVLNTNFTGTESFPVSRGPVSEHSMLIG